MNGESCQSYKKSRPLFSANSRVFFYFQYSKVKFMYLGIPTVEPWSKTEGVDNRKCLFWDIWILEEIIPKCYKYDYVLIHPQLVLSRTDSSSSKLMLNLFLVSVQCFIWLDAISKIRVRSCIITSNSENELVSMFLFILCTFFIVRRETNKIILHFENKIHTSYFIFNKIIYSQKKYSWLVLFYTTYFKSLSFLNFVSSQTISHKLEWKNTIAKIIYIPQICHKI